MFQGAERLPVRLGQRVRVGRRAAARARQDRSTAELGDHRRRVGGADRRHPQRHVAQLLHEDPAEAAQHRRAEERIGLDAEDHLAAAGDHALDQRAVEARRRRATPDLVEHVAEGSAHRCGVAAADANTAHVGLVRDVGRVEARSG